MIGGRARLLFDSYRDFEFRDGSASAPAPPLDWFASVTNPTAYFVASDQPVGPANTSLPSTGGALAFDTGGGGSLAISATSFNGRQGGSNPYFRTPITGVQAFGSLNPADLCICGTWIFATMGTINLASPWGATTCLIDFPFRVGLFGGTDAGVFKIVGYIYNGTVFVITEQTIGASLPATGFLAGMTCAAGGNVVTYVDNVGGSPVSAGAGNASNVNFVGFGFGTGSGGTSTQFTWARVGFKSSSAWPSALAANWMAYDLAP